MYNPTIWDDSDRQRLLLAMVMTQNKEQAKAILGDILTTSEIEEVSRRLSIAYHLDRGKSYDEIRRLTGASTTTIASVSKSMKEGSGGYRLLLTTLADKFNNHFTSTTKE